MNMRIPFLILMCLGHSHFSISQSRTGTELFKRGDTLAKVEKYQQALVWFAKAVERFQSEKNPKEALHALDAVRNCNQNLFHFDEALAAAERAMLLNRDSLKNSFRYSNVQYRGYRNTYRYDAATIDYLWSLINVIEQWPQGHRDIFLQRSLYQDLCKNFRTYSIKNIHLNDSLSLLNKTISANSLRWLIEIKWPAHIPVEESERSSLQRDSILAQKYFDASLKGSDSSISYLCKSVILQLKTNTWRPDLVYTFLRSAMRRDPAKNWYSSLVYYFETNLNFDSAFFYVDRAKHSWWVKNDIIRAKAKSFSNRKQAISATLKTDTILAHGYFEKAIQFEKAKKYDSAINNHQKAARIFLRYNCWEKYIEETGRSIEMSAIYNTYDSQNFEYNFNNLLEIALILFEEKSNVITTIYARLAKGQESELLYEDALKSYKKALANYSTKSNSGNVAVLTVSIARVYAKLGDDDEAFQYFNRALEIITNSKAPDNALIAEVYEGLYRYYLNHDNFMESLSYLEKASAAKGDLVNEKDNAAKYNVLRAGIYHRMGKADLAIDFYRRTIQYYRGTKDWDHELGAINGISSVLFDKELWKELDKALRRADYLIVQNSSFRVRTTLNAVRTMNFIASHFGPASKKLMYYDRAIELNAGGQFNEGMYEIKEERRLDDGYMAGEKWLMANDPDYLRNKNGGFGYYIDENELLKSYWEKAMVLKKVFLEKKDTDYVLESLWYYQKCDTLIDRLYQSSPGQATKVKLSNWRVYLSEESIGVSLLAFTATKDPKYKEAAFHFMEKDKAGQLLEAVSESHAVLSGGVPDSLVEKETRLKNAIHYLEQQLAGKKMRNDSSGVRQIQNAILESQRDHETIIAVMETDCPNYFSLKHKSPVTTSKPVQANIKEGQAMLEFMLGYTASYAAVITSTSLDFVALPHDTLLHKYVVALRNSIILRSREDFIKFSSLVYKNVFQPMEEQLSGKGIKELIIVPDDFLGYVPFEALVSNGEGENYSQFNYLIKKYLISYSYSASLYIQNKETKADIKGSSYVAFAPVFNDVNHTNFLVKGCSRFYDNTNYETTATRAFSRDGKYISPLPGTEEEVKGISKLVTDKNLFAKYFLFKEAREEVIKSGELSKYRFIHFATHGIINDNYPELSGLLLSQDSTSREDGILYTGEIYGLKLNAELVVLSACETGLGKIVKGEGIMGLTRGWIYAGAKNVIVTLWKVSDQSTVDLMIDFYNHLISGNGITYSLREAKFELIKNPEYAEPYFWAPFILIGN